MLKRGLVNDLARIPHSLDMSSPMMAYTVNAALKPLEALSRIVNLPPTTIPGRSMAKHKPEGEQQDSTTARQSTSSSDNTRAQVSINNFVNLICHLFRTFSLIRCDDIYDPVFLCF